MLQGLLRAYLVCIALNIGASAEVEKAAVEGNGQGRLDQKKTDSGLVDRDRLKTPDITTTFSHVLTKGGEALEFPLWCHVEYGREVRPFPCRPALFGAEHFSTNNGETSNIIVPFRDNGCSEDTARSKDIFEGAFALIKRGSCPFVKKALAAQAAGAVGVLISDYPIPKNPSRKQLEELTGERASAESGVMLMWSEKSDKALADNVTIPVLSVKHEDFIEVFDQAGDGKKAASLSVEYTKDFRAELGYVAAVDLLNRHPPPKGSALRPLLFSNIGKASQALQLYSVAESALREAIFSWPHKSREALPSLRRLGVLLVNHTSSRDKWTEALSTLPGDKGYKCSIAEAICQRIEQERLPAFINSADDALEIVWETLRQAENIQGGAETPRVWLDQAIAINLKRDKGKNKTGFTYNPAQVRYLLKRAHTASMAYNNERVYNRVWPLLAKQDKDYPLYTPRWVQRFQKMRALWNKVQSVLLWPLQKLGMVANEKKGRFDSVLKYGKDIGEVDPNFQKMSPGDIMERWTKDIY